MALQSSSHIQSPTSELTRRYIIALVVTGLLLLTGQILIEIKLEKESDEVNDIFDAGKLQTAGQTIARTVLEFQNSHSPSEHERLLDELATGIAAIEQQSAWLRYGDGSADRLPEHRPSVLKTLDKIEPSRVAMLASARSLHSVLSENPTANVSAEIASFLRYDLKFTEGVSQVLALIVEHDSGQMRWMRVAQISLLVVIVLIALLISLYIFRPALQNIRQTISNMQEAQNTLQQSEERFTKIFRSAPLAISISTLQEGTLLSVNKAFEELSGYVSGELLGKTTLFSALRISEEDEKKIRTIVSERGSASTIDFTFRRKDGSIRYAILSVETITLDGRTSLITTIKDLTERTLAAREIEQKETHFRSLIEYSNDIIAVLSSEGAIRYCGQSIRRILGYNPDLLIGRSFFDFVYREDRNSIVQFIGDVQQQSDLVLQLGDFQMLRSNGTLAHFEAIASNQLGNQAVNGIIVNARDISDRVAAAAELTQSQEQFAMMFRTAPVAICITTLVDSRYLDVNEAYEALSGYSRDELISKTVDEMNIQPSAARRSARRIVTEMRPIRNLETELQTKEGERRFVLTSIEHVQYNGEMCVFAISIDITELKKTREALGQSEDRFATIFHTSPASINIKTLDGRFVDVNDSFCETLGYTREELIGSTTLELGIIGEAGLEFRDSLIKKLQVEGRQQRVEATFRHRSGNIRHYLSSIDLITLDGKEMMLSIGQDVTELKQAEQLKKEYEQRFTKVFQTSPAAIGITTVDDGRYIEVNDEYCALSGFTREELIGHTSVELGIFDEAKRADIINEFRRTGSLKRVQLEMTRKNGEKWWSLASIDSINLIGGNYLVSILIDVTDLNRTENMRAQLEERFSKVFYASPLPILITTEREGDIVDANDSYVRLSGFTREELLNKNVIDLNLITYSDNRDNLLRELSHRSSLSGVQGTMITRGGEERRLLVSVERIRLGGVAHLLKMAVDITDSMKAANALAESERRFRSLFDVAAIGIGIIDIAGSWLLVNQKLCDITGYRREEFYTAEFPQLTHPDDAALDSEFVERLLKKEITEFSLEKRYKRKDGSVLWGRVTTSLVRDDSDTPQYFIRVVQDITEQRADRDAVELSEEKFARVFHAAPLGIFIVTTEGQKFLEVNESFEQLTGHTRKELIGKKATDVGIVQLTDLVPIDGEGSRRNTESTLHTRSGEQRTVLLSAEPAVIDSIPCLITMVLDVTGLKQASELLQQQEAYFQSIIERSSDVVIVFGRDVRIRYASPSCERQIGYSQADLTNTTDLSFVHPDDLASVEHVLLDALRTSSGGSLDCFRVVRRDGEVRFFEMALTNLTQTDFVEGLVMTCRDITERIRAEQELRETHLRLRATFEQSAVGIAHLDIEGRWLRVNRKVCDITGFSREELLTRTFQDITHPDDIEADMRQAYQLLRNEIPSYTMDKRYIRKDGSAVWVQLTCSGVYDDAGNFKFFIAFIEDISLRRRSEEAHIESEQRFRMLADTTPVMLWMSDTTGLCTFFNKRWLDFTGRPLSEELGNGWANRVHPDDAERCLDVYQTNFNNRQEFHVEYRLLRRDNQYRWLLDHGVPRYLPDGSFDGYIGTCIDITEVRKASADIGNYVREHDDERRLQSVVLSNIGQEIRAPLHGIMGFSYLLGKEAGTAEHQFYAQNIHKSARFLVGALNNVVLLSQIESASLDTTPTELLLQNEVRLAMDTVREEAREKSLDLHYHGIHERIVLHANQRLLARLLENLLQNAVKFTDTGTIDVHVAQEMHDNKLFGIVTIEDTGVGISPDFLQFVFENYTQEHQGTDRRFEGVGLGLTVVKKIAEMMGAVVRVRSIKHEGSAFTVRIPLGGSK